MEDTAEEGPASANSSSNPNPNHNSPGVSAADSVRFVEAETELRVPCYCEENVWRLVHRKFLQTSLDGSSGDYWVVFVSNPVKNVPMFHQRAASSPTAACCWDYHVILLGRDAEGGVLVWDMDSTLSYPCRLSAYLDQTFPYDWPEPHGPQFRLVPADVYRNTFASNRSHMYSHRKWSAAPPPYDVIQTDSDTHTLPYLLDFAARLRDETHRRLAGCGALGNIFSLQQLREYEFLQ